MGFIWIPQWFLTQPKEAVDNISNWREAEFQLSSPGFSKAHSASQWFKPNVIWLHKKISASPSLLWFSHSDTSRIGRKRAFRRGQCQHSWKSYNLTPNVCGFLSVPTASYQRDNSIETVVPHSSVDKRDWNVLIFSLRLISYPLHQKVKLFWKYMQYLSSLSGLGFSDCALLL